MKVKSTSVGRVERLMGSRVARSTPVTSSSASVARSAVSDDVAVSNEARLVGAIGETVRSSPEIRLEKVKPIQDSLAQGRYDVDSLKIADRILRQVLLEGRKPLRRS